MACLQRETSSQIPIRFCVGDRVDVLVACHLPKRETVQGGGVVERVTESSSGEALYWVSGFSCARTSRVLRLVQRAR